MIFPKAKKIAIEQDWHKTKVGVFGLYKGYFFNVSDAGLLSNPQFKFVTATTDHLTENQKVRIKNELDANQKNLKFTSFAISDNRIFFQFAENLSFTKLRTVYSLLVFYALFSMCPLLSSAQILENDRDYIEPPYDSLFTMEGVGHISIFFGGGTEFLQTHKLPDKKGRLVCKVDFEESARPSRIQYFIYEPILADLLYLYDYDGQDKTITMYNSAGHYFQWVYEGPFLREARLLWPKGDVKAYWRFLYNSDDLLTTVTKLTPSGTQLYEVLRLYDSKNQLVEYREVDTDGIYAAHQHFYDQNGNRIKSEIKKSSNYHGKKPFATDGSLLNMSYRISKYHLKAGEGGWWEYAYDDRGNLIESKVYRPNGKLYARVENEFDERDRPVKSTNLRKDLVEEQIIRTFNPNGTLHSEAEISLGIGKKKWEVKYFYSEQKVERIELFIKKTATAARFDFEYDLDEPAVGNGE